MWFPGQGRSHPRLLSIVWGVLFLFSLSFPAHAIDTAIELPVEYFFGRWAQGVAVAGQLTVEDPFHNHWFANTLYSDRGFQVGLSGWRGSSMPYRYLNGRGGSLAVRYRPHDQLQIGIDDVSYARQYIAGTPERSIEIRDFRAAVSSRWARSPTIHLSGLHAQYVYTGGQAVGPGEALWTASGTIQTQRENEDFRWSDELIAEEQSNKTAAFQSNMLMSVSRRMLLHLGVSMEIERHLGRYDSTTSTGSWENRATSFSPTLDLMSVLTLGEQSLLEMSFEQQFEDSYEVYHQTIITFPGGQTSVRKETSDPTFRAKRTRIGVGLSRFSIGRFNPQVIPDDYLGFYRGMLFAGQQRMSFGLSYENFPYETRGLEKLVEMQASFSRGLGGNLNIEAECTYSWEQSWFLYPQSLELFHAREEIDSYWAVSWRSYDYEPDRGPGWDRDTPADIAFGPLLNGGQVYLRLACDPPGLYSLHKDRGSGFMSFSGMEGIGSFNSLLEGDVGLGLRTALSVRAGLAITGGSADWFGNQLTLSAGLRKRFADVIEFRSVMQQEYEEGRHDPPKFALEAAGMFW